jgi:RNA polymerase sigma factor (sigma-70 family)
VARLCRAVSKSGSVPKIEVSNELNYESFNFAFNKVFGHANDPGVAYEQLRRKLIRIFLSHGHSAEAEYLTDDVIDRILKKACDGSLPIEGDNDAFPRFALGVARNVLHEQLRERKKRERVANSYIEMLWQMDSFQEVEHFKLLASCFGQLQSSERELLTKYYGVRRRETKRLAAELGMTHENLRIQVFRLRKRLREMVDQYLNS